VHSCQVSSLPRLASAAARVAERVRQLRVETAEFRLDTLAAELFDLLATARALLVAGPVQASWVGAARRAYRPVLRLRLAGLFTVPVVSPTASLGWRLTCSTEAAGADDRERGAGALRRGAPRLTASPSRSAVARTYLALAGTGMHL
jgi:hypothetical protein